MRTATARPSPMSTTPAPSPGPTSTHGAVVGNRDRNARDDLYEQCSDHITEYMASSRWLGSRPSSSTTAASSSSVMPSRRCNGCWLGDSAITSDRSDGPCAAGSLARLHPHRLAQLPHHHAGAIRPFDLAQRVDEVLFATPGRRIAPEHRSRAR